MEVRAGGPAGGSAQADDVSGAHPVSGLYIPAGEMGVEGLQAVGMADDHQVAIAAHIGRYPHLSVKRGGNRRAGRIGQVYSLMPTTVTVAEEGTGMRHMGAHIGVQRIHHPQRETVRNGIRIFAVRIDGSLVPKLRENTVLCMHGRILHIAVGTIVVEHHLDGGVSGIQRISIGGGTQIGGFHFLPSEGITE